MFIWAFWAFWWPSSFGKVGLLWNNVWREWEHNENISLACWLVAGKHETFVPSDDIDRNLQRLLKRSDTDRNLPWQHFIATSKDAIVSSLLLFQWTADENHEKTGPRINCCCQQCWNINFLRRPFLTWVMFINKIFSRF